MLRKYIPGNPEFIPYVKELSKDSTSQKAKGKAPGPKSKDPSTAEGVVGELKDLSVTRDNRT